MTYLARRSVVLFLLLTASAHASSAPSGWWIADAPDGDVAALRLSSDRLMWLSAKKTWAEMPLAKLACEGAHCDVTVAASKFRLSMGIDVNGDRLVTTERGASTAFHRASTEEARALDIRLEKAMPPDNACAVAEACCQAAFPLFGNGATCDFDFQMPVRDRFRCVALPGQLREMLVHEHKAIPKACR